MVSRILISIALLCSSVAMSQDENGLAFSQVLIVDISPQVTVPEGKVWKVVSVLREQMGGTSAIYIDDTFTWLAYEGLSTGLSLPLFLPEGTTIGHYQYINKINVIEFNTD